MGWLLFYSITGNLIGSLITYYIAYYYGRTIVKKYGKYFFLTDEKLEKVEKFFKTHGHISVFIGRISPGLKHFISFPAGLGKMPMKLFVIYSGLGGALWTSILVFLGYFIGNNENVIKQYLTQINIFIIIFSIAIIVIYALSYSNKNKHR